MFFKFFFREMPLWPIRVLTVSVVAITDIGVYLYDNYIADRPQPIGNITRTWTSDTYLNVLCKM